jgi:hypothetical protein
VPFHKRSVPGFPPRRPEFASGQGMWGLWWTKRYWGRFSPSTSVSPANLHSTNFSIIIITRRLRNRAIGGRSAEWTQLDSTPHYTNLKKKYYIIFLTYFVIDTMVGNSDAITEDFSFVRLPTQVMPCPGSQNRRSLYDLLCQVIRRLMWRHYTGMRSVRFIYCRIIR